MKINMRIIKLYTNRIMLQLFLTNKKRQRKEWMTFYLDTNALREILSFDMSRFSGHQIFTSELVIGELISGIVTEDEYIKRRNILKKIQEKNINILWESPKTLFIKEFALKEEDTDVEATKLMMERIIKTSNYQELKDIEFTIKGSEPYTLDIFIDFDDRTNKGMQEYINMCIQIPSKEDKKEMRENECSPQYVQVTSELIIRNMLMGIYQIDSVDNKDYLNSVNTYFKNRKFDTYFKAVILSSYNTVSRSQNAGSNDCFDFWNLTYASNINYFVSNDKIYKRLRKFEDNFFDVKFINLVEMKRDFS